MENNMNFRGWDGIFASRLRTLHDEQNLTMNEIADNIGVTLTTVYNYEHGKRIPDVETVARIADYLNVSADYLIGLKAERE